MHQLTSQFSFIALLHSSLYCTSPSRLSSFFPSQLHNFFHSAASFSSQLPSLNFVVLFFLRTCFSLYFSSVDYFYVRCLFQLHWTFAHIFHVISRPSKREGYPCKALVCSHLPKWASLLHSTLLTKQYHHL